MLDLLFVYGTLRRHFENRYARLLRDRAELLGAATVPGSIYRVGHFPAYRPEPAGDVHGELYRMQYPVKLLRILDKYEGPQFERITVNGAWLYQYKEHLPVETRIASGDFCVP
jgi:gamma-glutamylcyclotransferase (GGCT)/AIG2-like uncharacterized protein YtfP